MLRLRSWVVPVLLLASGVVNGCAEERDPINRVQSNALDKAFFVGDLADPKDDPEFLFRNYVVDGSASQSLVTVGTGSEVDRIRWEITEDLLTGRKAYQKAKHSMLDSRTTRQPGYSISQRIRKRVEEIFGWAKTVGGFRRTRFRGAARTQFAGYIVGAAYNLARMSRLLAAPT